ncbi:MAG TPA: MMPL family transporter [Polyangiaceae bacterium]
MAFVLVTLIPTGILTSHLSVHSAFSELLPDNKRSVIEMRRLSEHLTSSSTLTVVAESENVDALKHFVDELAPRIRQLDPNVVSSVDDGTREVREFFRAHKHLYADLTDIQKIHDDVLERYDYEVQKQAGMALDEDEAPPRIDGKSLGERFQTKIDEAEQKQPGTDGYYIGKSRGHMLGAIMVRTKLGGMNPKAFELEAEIEALIRQINPQQWDPALTVGFTGNLITSAEQHRVVTKDLTQVGRLGVGMILGVVFLFFLRFRVLLCMGVTILVGCVWSFAVARLTVGYLNLATGFLVSIIAGNGINFGIIYMARYIEARRDERKTPPEAVLAAHRGTCAATLAVAVAAMAAYGSLAVTNFRGFKHFGLIGSIGMLLCWFATYILLPAVLVLTERYSPMFRGEGRWRDRLRGVYGQPFVWAAKRAPRALTVLGLALGAVTIVVSARYFEGDPMEYDMRNISNANTGGQTSASILATRVDEVVGRTGQDGLAIVVNRLDQVDPLVKELTRRRDAAPAGSKPFDKVVTIFDLLPKDQQEKLALLAEIRDRVERGHRRHFVTDEDYKSVNEYIPQKLAPLGIDDLPLGIVRPFVERDGTRGRIVFIVPTTGRSIYDAHYLEQWADAFREVRLPNGDVIYGSGDQVIYADMLIAVQQDAPKAIFWSLVGTILVIAGAFGARRSGVLALAALLIGVSWLVAFLALRGIKLNFLNFVALPISMGVGADYALNIMKRRDLTKDVDLAPALVETGGAVVLCSATTTLGYLALTFSINRAVRSFGLAAAVGEMTTLSAAVLLLPAILFWQINVRKRRGQPRMSEPSISK